MKILNEEHFENVKRYAESIGDTSLQKCLERLKSWEGNPDYPSEISLYYIIEYQVDILICASRCQMEALIRCTVDFLRF